MPIKNSDCAATYKVLIVGDSGVGKSAILNCLMGRGFDERWRPTVGVDFVTKIIEADGALIELRIWDTAGLECFRSMTRRQFRGVQGVLLVYDVTNRASFDSLTYWITSIPNGPTTSTRSARCSYEPVPFVVLANKSDRLDDKTVGCSQGKKMAKTSMAFGFYETSAKTGQSIFDAFHKMAFTITDINHPRLMKSYHRHQIRPFGIKDDVMSSSLSSPSSSSVVSLRQHSTPSSSSLRKSSTSSSRRHTVSVLPFSILRTKTKAIRTNAKRSSWSMTLPKLGDGNGGDRASRNKSKRKTFGGWETKQYRPFHSNRERTELFPSQNIGNRKVFSNIGIPDPPVQAERENDSSFSEEKKKRGKSENYCILFSCFGWKRKKKRRKRTGK